MIPLLGGLGLIVFGYGMYQLLVPKDDGGVVIEKASSDENSPSQKQEKTIVVDIEGAVEKPGVYTLLESSRVNDAILKAGGLSVKVDKEALAKGINLAARLGDGQKIYIPFEGEQPQINTSGAHVAGIESSVIRINSASASELDSLPGVGSVTADKIISNRPYSSLEELVSKKAVTKSTYEKIKDRISL